jgi:hypothetical protein
MPFLIHPVYRKFEHTRIVHLPPKKMGNLLTRKFIFVFFNLFNLGFFQKRLELPVIVTEMTNQNSLIRLSLTRIKLT